MNSSGVLKVESFASYEQLFLEAIKKELGPDRGTLKAFEVKYAELTPDERRGLTEKGMADRLISISGALGLDDSGINWRVFNVNVEEGLSIAEDAAMALTLAQQCAACVADMKAVQKTGVAVHHV